MDRFIKWVSKNIVVWDLFTEALKDKNLSSNDGRIIILGDGLISILPFDLIISTLNQTSIFACKQYIPKCGDGDFIVIYREGEHYQKVLKVKI
jgi:hypothetical protein